jgi:hypothetical protein
MILPVLLTPQQVADWLQIKKSALYARVERNTFPEGVVVRINNGKTIRFREDLLKMWLLNNSK